MVPDQLSFRVQLGGEFGEVRLFYPLGALRRLEQELKVGDGALQNLHELLAAMTPGNVAVFLWGGMLHLPLYRELPVDTVKQYVEWVCVPLNTLTEPVAAALAGSLQGEPQKEEEVTAKQPQGKAPLVHGRGRRFSRLRLPSWVYRLLPSGGRRRFARSPRTSAGTGSSSLV